MRVLVTRPQASADTTLRRLEAAGHATLCLPMTWAEHFPDGLPARFDDQNDQASSEALPRALVVTSAQAIKAVRQAPDILEGLRSRPVYAVGAVTAQVAADAGFGEVRVGPGDGGGLARRVVGDYGRHHSGLLYCAGLPRAPDFERIVHEARVPLDVLLVYRMRAVHREPQAFSAAVRAFAPDAILFHSREAVRLFFAEMAPADLPAPVRILCLADRIAAAVPGECQHVQVASRPDEPALLALLDA